MSSNSLTLPREAVSPSSRRSILSTSRPAASPSNALLQAFTERSSIAYGSETFELDESVTTQQRRIHYDKLTHTCCAFSCDAPRVAFGHCSRHIQNPSQKTENGLISDLLETTDRELIRAVELFKSCSEPKEVLEYVTRRDEAECSPIVDVQVVWKERQTPHGYTLLSKSVSRQSADLNKGAGGKYVYLCYKNGPPGASGALTSLSLCIPKKFEESLLGYQMLHNAVDGSPADLNTGSSSGMDMYLGLQRLSGPKIIELAVVFPSRMEATPPGFYRITKTVLGREGDLNFRNDGTPVFLCFRTNPLPYLRCYYETNSRSSNILGLAMMFLLNADVDNIHRGIACVRALLVNKILTESISDELIDHTLGLICHLVTVIYSVHFGDTIELLFVLIRDIFASNLSFISPMTMSKVFQLGMFLRHNDRKIRVLSGLVEFLGRVYADSNPGYSGADSQDITTWVKEELVLKTTDWIILIRCLADAFNEFALAKDTDSKSLILTETILYNLTTDPVETSLSAMTLMLCRCASEEVSLLSSAVESETVKRKLHALKLLQKHVKYSKVFFRDTMTGVYLLRRAIFPALVSCCLSPVSALLQSSLMIIHYIWKHFRSSCKLDMCILMDSLLLEMLKSDWCYPEQKIAVLEGINMLFQTPESIANFYFNFDYQSHKYRTYEKLISTLSDISQGKGLNLLDQSNVALQCAGLAAIVNIVELLSKSILRYSGMVVVKKKQLRHIDSIVDDDILQSPEARAEFYQSSQDMFEEAEPLENVPVFRHSLDEEKDEASPRARTSSLDFYTLVANQKEREKEAARIAGVDGVKAAVKFLMKGNTQYDAKELARFLKETPGLAETQIGDFIGSDYTRWMTVEDFIRLRTAYVSYFNFSGMAIVRAMRLLLTNGGFRLPGESQKIERILESFADCYFIDNPGTFPTAESTFITCYSIIMLNVDIHHPVLATGNRQRPHMTLEGFVKNTSFTDRGDEIDPKLLVSIYREIEAEPIEWEGSVITSTRKSVLQQVHSRFEKESEVLLRTCLGKLREELISTHSYHRSRSKRVVQDMFEVSWEYMFTALSALVYRSKSVDVVAVCLDGIKYATTCCILLGMEKQALGFAGLLARINYTSEFTGSNQQLQMDFAAKKHLEIDWFIDLPSTIQEDSRKACHRFNFHANSCKNSILYARDQKVLEEVESSFQNDVRILGPNRKYIRDETLVKYSGKHTKTYRFFLLTDLLIYASQKSQGKFKVKGVIHLSLCRLVDLKDSRSNHRMNCMEVINPQKPLKIMFPDALSKSEWAADLKRAIEAALHRQRKWIEDEENHFFEPSQSDSNESPLRPENGPSVYLGSTTDNSICKLCIQRFGKLTRRRYQCPYCEQVVCGSCSEKTGELIDKAGKSVGQTRVCDVCFGILTGLVQMDAPVLIQQ